MNHLLTAELGCGSVFDRRFDEFVDVVQYGHITYHQNFVAMPRFGDNRFCLIKSSASLEHLTPADQIRAVREWHRILCPNGVVVVQTPDSDWITWAVENGEISKEWGETLRRGGQRDEYDVHKGLLDAKGLQDLFESNGYRTVYLRDGNQAAGSLDASFEAIK